MALAMAVLAAVGLGASFVQWRLGDRTTTCSSDFLNFYTGAKLAFSGQIYLGLAEARVQHEALGCSGYAQFVRLPYFAGVLWPLAQLPFREALVIWRWLALAAVVGFIGLW